MSDKPIDPEAGKHPAAAAFETHYHDINSGWGGNSGPDSSVYFTIEYRAFLEKFMRMNRVQTVVDIGCGDWQFSRLINYEGITYAGFDIVERVIQNNVKRYQSDTISFYLMPDDLSQIPAGDLLVMKDVLQHLPEAEIKRLEQHVFRRFKHVLLTNSYEKLDTPQNIAIGAGSFRCLDLSVAPFHFNGSYVLEFGSAVWERIRTFHYWPGTVNQ